jgi:hypothetical protein
MRNGRQPSNPSRFIDMLDEQFYATGPEQEELKRRRENLVAWLRTKGAGNEKAVALADKLEDCRRKHRCKSGACPECTDAARRLFTKTLRRYLKGKANVACITIVPADGIARKGSLA